eukprot:gene6307-4528_t
MSIFCLLIAVCLLAFVSQADALRSASTLRRFMGTRAQVLMMAKKDVSMPALSSTMKEGRIVSWGKKVGDKVSAGDILLVVESDKADMDVESFEDGYLGAIYTPEGGTAAVGAVVATIVDSMSEMAGGSANTPAPAAAAPPAQPKSAAVPMASGPKPKFEPLMMPSLSSTMKEGKVVSWSKAVGDKISSGDMVLVVESDKADMDVESYEEGYLAAILVKDGEMAPVGSPVAYLTKSKDEIAAVQAFVASGGSVSLDSSAPVEAGSAPANIVAPTQSSPTSSSTKVTEGRVASSGYAQTVAKELGVDLHAVQPTRGDQYITSKDVVASASSGGASRKHIPAPGVINASPVARKLASENNLDVRQIIGTGNFDRVLPDDVLRAAGKLPPVAAPAPAAAPAVATSKAPAAVPAATSSVATAASGRVALTGMQKAVAKNMEKSLSVPVFRVSRDIVTDNFDALYAKLKSKGVSVSALLAKAVAEVCKKHPIMNAAFDATKSEIVYNDNVNVAMAVAIDGGLITPTIMKAQDMDLFAISRTWKDLVDRAKTKKLSPAEYSSGTITISNLGMFGVSSFDAILPPGTGAILAIAAAQPRVVQLSSGYFSVQKTMTVTVTSDHRHIYGAHVAEFLKELADLLENRVDSLTMG